MNANQINQISYLKGYFDAKIESLAANSDDFSSEFLSEGLAKLLLPQTERSGGSNSVSNLRSVPTETIQKLGSEVEVGKPTSDGRLHRVTSSGKPDARYQPRTFSAETRAKMSQAQRLKWQKRRGEVPFNETVTTSIGDQNETKETVAPQTGEVLAN